MTPLPDWADDLRRRYLRGEASIFVLHGNVFDSVLSGERFLTLTDFLGNVLLKESKETIAVYNVATGVRFQKRGKDVENVDDLILQTEKTRVLGALERMLIGASKAAAILEYAEVIAPAGDPNFQSESDRAAVVTLHRWSMAPEIEASDSVVLLLAENLSELHPKLVSNPKIATVRVAMPDEAERGVAKKNYEVILKRIDKLRDIHNYLGVARGQLDLIENSFQLISDQIVTMQSPTELSGQLDDLLDGVDSIRQTAIDTEKMLGSLEA